MGIVITQNTILAQEIKPTEAQVRAELNKRGLSEEEVTKAFLENGIDPNNIENATPDQIIKIQKIISDLEKQKNEDKNNNNTKPIEQAKDTIKNEVIEEAEQEDLEVEDIDSFSPIYGHDILNKFVKNKKTLINVSENYILGGGDKISISIWSDYSQFDNNYVIDKDGYIKIETSGIRKKIYLQGLTLGRAKEKITKILSRNLKFNLGEINISLESSRNINISIYGEVNRPGTYNINATNSVFDGLKYSKGVTRIASVRNIKLISSSGNPKVFDLYRYLDDPQYGYNFFLKHNDLIHVPVAEKIVVINGAVKRPFAFELLKDEGLSDLIKYAGGFSKDAIKDNIQIERYIGDKKVLIGVDYTDDKGKISDFSLMNGDTIFVRKILSEAKNFYKISGRVYKPGRFARLEGKTISMAITEAGLMPDSKTDFAILIRKNKDYTPKYITLDIDKILKNRGNSKIDFILQNEDEITIWSQGRYSDKSVISIFGAVRDPKDFKYGSTESINISDALRLAGGLTRDASNFAIIHRQDPLKNFTKQYIKVNLKRILNNPNSTENINLQPFDKLEVLSENLFNEETFVIISGAVNNPDTFQYGKNMSLKDLIYLAGGFKLAASTNNIEVSRMEIRNNKPTKVSVAKINMDRDINLFKDNSDTFILEPYDNVYVRYVPDFQMQKVVSLKGELKYPGDYTLTDKNEKVSDVINRAGGFTEEAFIDGATIYRYKDNVGFIVMQLEKAMKNHKSRYNYILKDGDVIDIPKQRDFVTIRGETKVSEMYKDEIAFNENGINVPYHDGKRAMYYINKYAGGINPNGSRNEIIVEHANGEISKTHDYGLFKIYPSVKKGSIIKVRHKRIKTKDEKDKKEVDWNKIISDSVAQISTIMTLVILFKSLSQ